MVKTNKKSPKLIIIIILAILVIGIRPSRMAAAAQKAYQRLMSLTLVLDKIERYYVDEKDPDALIEAAVRGMLSTLDPHTVFLKADEYAAYKSRYQGYQGIGIKYSALQDRLIVISVAPKSPAAEMGIRLGDKIVRIAGKKIAYLEPEDIPRLLQQPTVQLEIEREGTAQALDLTLPKRTIPPITIPCAFMLNDSVGFIKIERFSDGTPEEFDDAFAQLQTPHPSYLVLDLRGNPGGDFNAAIKTADRFLPGGKLIAFTRGRGPSANMQYVATLEKKLLHIPLVVLVDQTSASDAEIVAGALQDWDRGLIVGQPTYGKALVQTEYAFQDGSALLLTTARFFTPLGRSLQKTNSAVAKTEASNHGTEVVATFRTPKGRILLGGGSIIPDVILSQQEMLSPALNSLLSAEENYFFDYAEHYYMTHPSWGNNKEHFARSFQVSDEMLREFLLQLRRSGQRFTLQDFAESKEQLKWLIKREIAVLYWGEEARQMINILQDPQVKESCKYLLQAKKLLNRE